MPNHQQSETPASTPQRVSEEASKLTQRAESAAERAHHTAVERVQETRDRVRSQLDERRGRTVQRMQSLSSELRDTGDRLRGEREDDVVAKAMSQVSERIERFASYLSSTDPQDMVKDAEKFARERPGLFLGGAFLLGLATGRFLRSTQAAATQEEGEP